MIHFLLSIFWLIYSPFGWPSQASGPTSGVDYRFYQSAVRALPMGPKSSAYAVCDMMETFTGVPARLDAERMRACEREHTGEGAWATFYQYLLERRGLARQDTLMDSTNEATYAHYVCPTGSVLSFAQASKINAPNKIVSLLNQGIKGIVVTYDYCPNDWKKGNWKLGALREKHRPKAMHTVLIVGHRDSTFIFKNVWGNLWGEEGYGTMTFDYHRKHAREGIVTYLAEVQEPKTQQFADIAFKTQPESLDGKDYLQISLIAAGPGRLPIFTSVDYVLSKGGRRYDVKKALLLETGKSNGFPCLLEVPQREEGFDITCRYATANPEGKGTFTLRDLRWENAEFVIPAE